MPNNISKSQRLKSQGLWTLVGGLAITIATQVLAENGGGGIYILAWGPVLFGPVLFFRGVMLQGTPEDVIEIDEPEPILSDSNKCPSCGTTFSSNQDYCKFCGRYLKL